MRSVVVDVNRHVLLTDLLQNFSRATIALAMRRLTRPFKVVGKFCSESLTRRLFAFKLILISLIYNHHLSYGYAFDTAMEPLFWFVDNFTHVLGPLFVAMVVLMLAMFILIAYLIGLPYYWYQHNSLVTAIAVIAGHWLLANVVWNYYKALRTPPGYPSMHQLPVQVSSLCKKCISPKPPRTHHCSVCKRCVLKMDHHCPWLNNCVGFYNHHYFYFFCFYTWIGTIFVMIFGFEIAYKHIWLKQDLFSEFNEDFENFNSLDFVLAQGNSTSGNSDNSHKTFFSWLVHIAIVYESLTCIGVFVAVGCLLWWHSVMITEGETCIERLTNRKEASRLKSLGKKFKNSFDFGPRENWRRFLGLNQKDKSWWDVVLPSEFKPVGDGIYWKELEGKM